MNEATKKHGFKSAKEAVRHYYNLVKRGRVDIAPYIKKHGRGFEGMDTNRFTSYVFSETGIKPTTIERAFRDLRNADRGAK